MLLPQKASLGSNWKPIDPESINSPLHLKSCLSQNGSVDKHCYGGGELWVRGVGWGADNHIAQQKAIFSALNSVRS